MRQEDGASDGRANHSLKAGASDQFRVGWREIGEEVHPCKWQKETRRGAILIYGTGVYPRSATCKKFKPSTTEEEERTVQLIVFPTNKERDKGTPLSRGLMSPQILAQAPGGKRAGLAPRNQDSLRPGEDGKTGARILAIVLLETLEREWEENYSERNAQSETLQWEGPEEAKKPKLHQRETGSLGQTCVEFGRKLRSSSKKHLVSFRGVDAGS